MTRQILIATSLWACLACGGGTATTPAAASTTPGTSPTYQIVLNRPLKAGDRFRVNVEAREQIEGAQSTTGNQWAGSTDLGENLQISLVGLLTIREVDAEGRAQSALLEVEDFKSADGKEVLPPGSRVDAVRGQGDFSLMINGQPRPEMVRVLRLAFPLHRPGSPLGDELFGSKEPRQVGDSWAFSKSSVANNLIEDGYTVRETDISGDTRLVGTTTVAGTACLELAAKMQVSQATLGEGWDLKTAGSGKIDATIKMVVPVDPKLPLAMEESSSTGEFLGHVQGDTAAAERKIKLTRYRRALYTRL